MKETSKIKEKPIPLVGILPRKRIGKFEEVLIKLIFQVEEGRINKDPKAHSKLLELGKRISRQKGWAGIRGKEVEEFLKFRKG